MKPWIALLFPRTAESRLLLALLTLLIGALMLGLLCWQQPERVALVAESVSQRRWMLCLFSAAVFLAFLSLLLIRVVHQLGSISFDEAVAAAGGDDIATPADDGQPAGPDYVSMVKAIAGQLRFRYGPFWRGKVRLLLVVGDDAARETLLPGLTEQRWLEGSRTLLVDGGSLSEPPDAEKYRALRRLRRGRPLDGIVRVLDHAQSLSARLSDDDLRSLEQIGALLCYLPPVWLWQLCSSGWPQPGRAEVPVGITWPADALPQELESRLDQLALQLVEQGMAQAMKNSAHDFLLRLSQGLRQGGSERWKTQLTPWLQAAQQRVVLCGLVFSLANNGAPPGEDRGATPALPRHALTLPASWQGVVEHCTRLDGRRIGWPWGRRLEWALMTAIGVWAVGMLLSFALNRQQTINVTQHVRALEQAPTASGQQVIDLQTLRNDIGLLLHWQQHGAPWYRRFGVSQHDALLATLLARYGEVNNRLIRDPASRALQQQLSALVTLPADSPLRAARAQDGYDALKAWLMMARPDQADSAFYARVMMRLQPERAGIAPALWQMLAPDLWDFYMAELPHQPQWQIMPDAALVSQSRQLLLQQIGRRNAESTLYQNLLKSLRGNFAEVTLADLTRGTDARLLFTTDRAIPGIFTRQAWEGGVRQAIGKAARTRRDEIDWVLSDARQQVAAEPSPEALQERLTRRYFTDFAGSWLDFLNSLRLNPTANVADVIDQLTLIGDVRQSPLIALINQLAWQGQTGQQSEALSASLLKSAQALTGSGQRPVIDQSAGGAVGPLDETFGPLLALTGRYAAANALPGDSSLSLQSYLTRVTGVRLSLQQMATSDDAQERIQGIAQNVFQDKSVELTDTRQYGSLIAASLGEEWSGFGQTLFVQPLLQAWQALLLPSAASLNGQWRRSVVDPWRDAFDGRYPFAASNDEASLPMLAEFLRKDSGRIERFIRQELKGVLRKEGSRWVADRASGQGLNVNPRFIAALNRLSALADVLFTDGDRGISFELQARPTPDVVQTLLIVDGQRLRYFNQMVTWQTFRWPGEALKPGTMLTWIPVGSGVQTFGDWRGSWGLIRWLELGKCRQLDQAQWLMSFTTPDGHTLQWILRSQLGSGPLQLLQLRNFRLPDEIFSTRAAGAARYRSTVGQAPRLAAGEAAAGGRNARPRAHSSGANALYKE